MFITTKATSGEPLLINLDKVTNAYPWRLPDGTLGTCFEFDSDNAYYRNTVAYADFDNLVSLIEATPVKDGAAHD